MSEIVLIGSRAMNYHLGNIRTPKDYDIIAEYDDFLDFVNPKQCTKLYPENSGKKLIAFNKNFGIVECEMTWDNSNSKMLYDLILEDDRSNIIVDIDSVSQFVIPSIDVLYMLKMSHRFLRNSPAFIKTMNDISLLEMRGAKFDERYQEWYDTRIKDTYHYDHPSLKKTKKEFFTDNVQYVYDHDSIHEAVKIFDKPAYTYFKDDQAEVYCSKDKFYNQPYQIQLASVIEESMVLAIERHQIPNEYKPNPVDSFYMALEKVCTSITSGWWRDFAYKNYRNAEEEFLEHHKNYVDKFKQALYDGRVIKQERNST